MPNNMLRNWIKKLGEKLQDSDLRRSRRQRSGAANCREASKCRPTVETLEDRLTPSNLVVTNVNPSGSGSLAAAVLQANNDGDDTITFASSLNGQTITLNSTLLLTNNVTITGQGAANTFLSGGGAVYGFGTASGAVRVFNIAPGVTATISGLTVENGSTNPWPPGPPKSTGAGIFNSGSLTLSNDTITGNSAVNNGGGIYNCGSLTMSYDTVSNNYGNQGGGIDNAISTTGSGGIASIGTLTLSNSTITGNNGGSGGGICNIGSLAVTNSTISDNNAANGGGISNGVYSAFNFSTSGSVVFQGTLSLSENTIITGNTVYGNGGGIYNNGGTITATSATISNNTAANGGGIYNGVASVVTNPFNQTYASYDGTLTLSGNTIANNTASSSGGGIYNSGSLAMTSSTSVTGNSAAISGGGVFNNGTATLSNCTFTDNGAVRTLFHGGLAGDGGAIGNMGSLTVSDSSISENSAASSGGGIENYGTLTLCNSTVANNDAYIQGGGISNVDSTATLSNDTIEGNASAFGGGVGNTGSTVTLCDDTLSGNSGSTYISGDRLYNGVGGGIAIDPGSTASLVNTTVFGNTAAAQGGGVYNEGAATLINVTVVGNSASGSSGGGIENYDGIVTLSNTIVAENNANNGPDIYAYNGNGIIASYSLIGNSADSNVTASSGGGLVLNPGCLGLSSLGNYGGATDTIALLPGSPAIDAGSNSLAVNANDDPLSYDQRGQPRIVNGTVDIGAFESDGFTFGIVSGNNQSVNVSTAFSPLVVSVTANRAGEPVNGGQVTFTVNPVSGAGASLATSPATISGGDASVTPTANATAGSYTATASANGASSVSFNLTNESETSTTTHLTDNGPNPSLSGRGVSYTVNTTSVPNGATVVLEDASNEDNPVGTVTISGNTGSTTISSLSVGTHSIFAAYGGDETHLSSQSTQVVQVVQSTFAVVSATPTSDGVVLTFNAPVDSSTTMLFSSPGSATTPDVTLLGENTGAVLGSLVIDPTNPYVATFVQTSGLLAADTYTVTVTTAVKAVGGYTMSGNYTNMFSVTGPTLPVLSVPSFARGAGQTVALPGATGIPVSISNATNVTQTAFTLTYDPTLLTIAPTAALSLSPAATEAGIDNINYSISSVDAHHDVLSATLTGGTGLTAYSAVPLVTIAASVPMSAPYGAAAVLNLANAVVNETSATGVSGVDESAYFGDVSGDGLISALDASLVNQVALGSGTGFGAYPDLDPAIIGAISGGSTVTVVDGGKINSRGAGETVAQIPATPTGTAPATAGPEAYLYLGSAQGPPGQTTTETLYLHVTDPSGISLSALDEAIEFNTSVLTVSNVVTGSGLAGIGSYSTSDSVNNTSGVLLVGQAFLGSTLPPTVPEGTNLAVMQFSVTLNAQAAGGTVSDLTLLQDGALNGQTKFTAISDNAGALPWTPGMAPSNSGNAAVDGTVTVQSSTSTTTSLTDNGPTPSIVGTAVSYTVSTTGVPNGSTVYLEDADSSNAVVGSVVVSGGTGSTTVSSLSIGSHSIFAVYTGAAGYTASQSTPALAQTVSPIAVTSVAVNGDFIAISDLSEASQTVTVTSDGINGFTAGNKVVIAGETGTAAGYNGTWTILSASGDTFTYTNSATGLPTLTFNANGYAISTNTSSSLRGSQRSMVDSVVYTFNAPVNLTSNALTLALKGGITVTGPNTMATGVANVNWTSLSGGKIWVMTFSSASGNTVTGHSIADGVYTLSLNSADVTAVAGGSTMTTTRATDTFYRLYADTNGQQRVSNADLLAFNNCYAQEAPSESYLAALDYNADGRVNNTDLLAFNNHYSAHWTGFTSTI